MAASSFIYPALLPLPLRSSSHTLLHLDHHHHRSSTHRSIHPSPTPRRLIHRVRRRSISLSRDASERAGRARRGRTGRLAAAAGHAAAAAVVQDGLLPNVRLHAAKSPVHRRRVPRQGGAHGGGVRGEGAGGEDIALWRRRRPRRRGNRGGGGADDTQGDHGRGAAGGGAGGAGPVGERQVDAALHPRRPPHGPPHGHRAGGRPRPVPRRAAPHGVRGPGRRAPPAPHRPGDAGLLRHAAAPDLGAGRRQAGRRGGGDRGAGAGRLRRHHRGQRVRARRLGRGAEARQHRARAAGEPEPAGAGRAHLRPRLHRRLQARGHALGARQEGPHGGALRAPAIQSRLPGLRLRAPPRRGQLHVLRARPRRHGLLRLRRLRAGLPRQPRRLHARPRQWVRSGGVQRLRGGGRQREADPHRVLRQGARAQGEGRRQRRSSAHGRRARRAAAAGAGELQRVHELDEPVRDPAAAQPQGAPPRGLHVPPPLPDHRAGAGGGGHVVALHAAGGAGPDGPPLLRLHLLGRLRLLQRRLRLPAGAARARPGARIGHVLPLLLLHGQDGRRPAHGARPARRIHRHRLPHGGTQPGPSRLRAHPRRHPLLRARRRGPRARHRGAHDGRQARVHARHRHHAGLPPHRRLLRPQRPGIHAMGQVHLIHLLLLPPAHRRAVRRPPRAPAPAGRRARRGHTGDLRRRARRHVLRLPPARLPRAAPGQDVTDRCFLLHTATRAPPHAELA